MKLNIGAGSTRIDGWIPIDRKLGHEALPLPDRVDWDGDTYEITDDSVEEIRASHILEHFGFADAQQALREWVRVLQPGGRLRVAVPDFNKIAESSDDLKLFWLMGGQTDSDDFHRSAYDEDRLRQCMEAAGLENIRRWESANTDCASLPISLNLEGTKSATAKLPVATKDLTVKIGAYMTLPRYEATAARSVIESALRPLNISLTTSNGVFWGQCMQRMFEEAVAKEVDWILTIDGDSLFTAEHLSKLLHQFGSNPRADAMAALQCRRGRPFPLLTQGHNQEVETDGTPIKVTTAHFGLTLIRVEDLVAVPKPWFKAEPDKKGEWGDDRLDDDIWFWHQWRLAGKSIYVTPQVSIGHLEEMVAVFDKNLQARHVYVSDWRERFMDQ